MVLDAYWPWDQFSGEGNSDRFRVPRQGAIMKEFTGWMQGNWYSLGNLVAQFAFLIAGVWFARKILKTVRASQEQFGALLRLTMSEGLNERARASEAAHRALSGDRSTPYVMADWSTAGAPALSIPEREPLGKRLLAVCKGVIRWLKAPMSGHWLGPWRRVSHWLQTPVGS